MADAEINEKSTSGTSHDREFGYRELRNKFTLGCAGSLGFSALLATNASSGEGSEVGYIASGGLVAAGVICGISAVVSHKKSKGVVEQNPRPPEDVA